MNSLNNASSEVYSINKLSPESKQNKSFSFDLNQVDSKLRILFLKNISNVSVEIYSAAKELAYSTEFYSVSQGQQAELNIIDLNSGTFQLVVASGTGRVSEELIIE